MKNRFSFIFIIFGLISCQKDNNQRIKLNVNYFPLEIGNQWVFDVAGRDSVVNKRLLNGVEYFEIVDSYGCNLLSTIKTQ